MPELSESGLQLTSDIIASKKEGLRFGDILGHHLGFVISAYGLARITRKPLLEPNSDPSKSLLARIATIATEGVKSMRDTTYINDTLGSTHDNADGYAAGLFLLIQKTLTAEDDEPIKISTFRDNLCFSCKTGNHCPVNHTNKLDLSITRFMSLVLKNDQRFAGVGKYKYLPLEGTSFMSAELSLPAWAFRNIISDLTDVVIHQSPILTEYENRKRPISISGENFDYSRRLLNVRTLQILDEVMSSAEPYASYCKLIPPARS